MKEYHKIHSLFKRDAKGKFTEEWARDEFLVLKDCVWRWTEKVDGTNISISLEDGRLKIGGKTDNASIPAFLLDAIYKILSPEKFAALENSATMTLYGEGHGPKIQKGGDNYGKEPSFVLFDVKVGEWWLRRSDVADVGEKLGLTVVPEVGNGSLIAAIDFVKAGFKSTWGEFFAEGIVMRPSVDLFDRMGNRIITKLKHKDFLT